MAITEHLRKKNPEIIVNDDLKNYLPPLSVEEYEELDKSILSKGVLQKLIAIKNKELENNNQVLLIDGHNRYELCKKHKISFQIDIKFIDVDFDGLLEYAKKFIIEFQLGRRNMSDALKSYFIGLRYKNEKAKQGGDKKSELSKVQNELLILPEIKSEGNQPKSKNIIQGTTAKKLAEEYKVSESSIKRDEKFLDAIDKIAEVNPKLKHDILNKEINLTKKQVFELAEMPTEILKEPEKAIATIKNKVEDEPKVKVAPQNLKKLYEYINTNYIRAIHSNHTIFFYMYVKGEKTMVDVSATNPEFIHIQGYGNFQYNEAVKKIDELLSDAKYYHDIDNRTFYKVAEDYIIIVELDNKNTTIKKTKVMFDCANPDNQIKKYVFQNAYDEAMKLIRL